MKLNFDYFSGRVFDLDQTTMNKMIDDIHKLQKENNELKTNLLKLNETKTYELSINTKTWMDKQ